MGVEKHRRALSSSPGSGRAAPSDNARAGACGGGGDPQSSAGASDEDGRDCGGDGGQAVDGFSERMRREVFGSAELAAPGAERGLGGDGLTAE